MERSVRFAGLSLTIAVVFTVLSMGLAAQVSAISLTTSSTQFLGSIDPDGGSEATQADQINILIDPAQVPLGSNNVVIGSNTYDRTNNSCGTCPTATDVGSFKEELPPAGTGDNEGDFGAGFDYLKAKYGTLALVWYVAGLTGDFDIPSSLGQGGGLSHWVLFNPGPNVAEPSTMLLAGLAFAGVAFFSKKFLPKA
jgi:hypothetical protein